MQRRSFLKFLSSVLLFFTARGNALAAINRLFVPAPPAGSGIALRDIAIDKYGRPTVKGQHPGRGLKPAQGDDAPDRDAARLSSANQMCSCPDLICPCPEPPPPPWPVPDLICPCPEPPPAPFSKRLP